MTQRLVDEIVQAKGNKAAARREIELLLCCSRTYINPEIADQIKNLLQEDLDWIYLLQTASHHGVMPLLYSSLNNTCPEAIPQPLLSQLRQDFHVNFLHNIFLSKQLFKLLDLFAAHDIPAIPYKGPALASSVYGNLALRQFGDLDILIHHQDVQKAKKLLSSQGYHLISDLLWENHFVNEDGRVNVDLHWGITPSYFPFRLDFEDLWQRVEPLSLVNETIIHLSPEDLLIILCIQIAKDAWEKHEQLLKICDIDQLLRTHQALNWQKVMEQASTWFIERPLFLGLFLSNELFGTVLPEEVRQRTQIDPFVKLYAAHAHKQLFSETDSWSEVKDFFVIFLERLMVERSPDTVPYKGYLFWQFFRLAINPTEEDRTLLFLPKSLEFLYYFVRPIRLVKKYGLRLFNRFLGYSLFILTYLVN